MAIYRLVNEGNSESKLVLAKETKLEYEKYIEDWLEKSPWALAQEPILWIGRQSSAINEDGVIFPDLIGVDSEGNLVIVELKKNRAPREVIAQILEYAVWANELSEEQINDIADTYFRTREEFNNKTFHDTFKKIFELEENDDLPIFNQNIRLFIVAEEIPIRIVRVCRFLRSSHGLDISNIKISIFQTETDDVIVNTQTLVGDEEILTPELQRNPSTRFSHFSKETERQIIWETVQELTDGNTDIEFATKSVIETVLRKYPKFNPNTVNGILVADTENNDPAYPSSGENKYTRVKKGIYRLSNP